VQGVVLGCRVQGVGCRVHRVDSHPVLFDNDPTRFFVDGNADVSRPHLEKERILTLLGFGC
jgi:hypothetical protein